MALKLSTLQSWVGAWKELKQWLLMKSNGAPDGIQEGGVYYDTTKKLPMYNDGTGNKALVCFPSSGITSFPEVSWVDNGSGSITINAGKARLYDNPNFTGCVFEYNIPQKTFQLVDGQDSMLIVSYNGGSPEYFLVDAWDWSAYNFSDKVVAFRFWYAFGETHSATLDSLGLGLSEKQALRLGQTNYYARIGARGLALSTSGRTVLLTGAGVWAGPVQLIVDEFNSSTDVFSYLYKDASNNWIKVNANEFPNTLYNPSTGLETLTNTSKHTMLYMYRSIGDNKEMFCVLDTQEYNSSDNALLSKVRTDLPFVITSHCMLVGRIIIKNGETNPIEVQSAFDVVFQTSSVSDHESLSNLLGGDATGHVHITPTEHTQLLTNGALDVHFMASDPHTQYLLDISIEETKSRTGFVVTEQDIHYDHINRTITIQGSGVARWQWRGDRREITLPYTFPAHGTAFTPWFLSNLDGTAFVNSQLPWTYDQVQVAYINYDANPAWRFAIKETHGIGLEQEGHELFHKNIGTHRKSGGEFVSGSYLVKPATPTNDGNRPLMGACRIADEENNWTNSASTQKLYTQMWASADGTVNWSVEDVNLVQVGTYPKWDNNGVLTELANNKFMWVYLFEMPTTNDIQSQKFRRFVVFGNEVFNNEDNALLGKVSYRIGNLLNISPEFVCIRRILIETSASYTTIGKFRIVTDVPVEGSRTTSTNSVSGVTSHENLLGLLGGDTINGHWHLTQTEHTQLQTNGALDVHLTASDPHTQYILESTLNQPLGPLQLDSNAMIPIEKIPASLLGAVRYQTTWNASTNTPTLSTTPTAETKGFYYVVSTAGTWNGMTFGIRDWIISNGAVWQKIDNEDAVTSVFGRDGVIVAQNGDYTASQITNVPSGSISSVTVQGAINELNTEKEPTVTTGTTLQYYRGDKVWATLDKSSVGLNQVDNTRDADKPISTATQTALDNKSPLNTTLTDNQSSTLPETTSGTLVSKIQALRNNVKHILANLLALGETNTTAYRGDRGKIAYDHSQTTGNPHGTTKANVGLGSVDDTSDADKPISTATQAALNGKANTSHTHDRLNGVNATYIYPTAWATDTFLEINGNATGIGMAALNRTTGNTWKDFSIYAKKIDIGSAEGMMVLSCAAPDAINRRIRLMPDSSTEDKKKSCIDILTNENNELDILAINEGIAWKNLNIVGLSVDINNAGNGIYLQHIGTTKLTVNANGVFVDTPDSSDYSTRVATTAWVRGYSAPVSHASTSTTHGVATSTNYGHAKLYDNFGTNTDGACTQNAVTSCLGVASSKVTPIANSITKSYTTNTTVTPVNGGHYWVLNGGVNISLVSTGVASGTVCYFSHSFGCSPSGFNILYANAAGVSCTKKVNDYTGDLTEDVITVMCMRTASGWAIIGV